jgi:uncharacterized protein
MFDRPVVDSVTFAREAQELSGETAVRNLTRLHDALADDTGGISYRLSGFVNAEGKPSLQLSVSGDLKLVCQRCLGSLDFRLDAEREFELVAQGVALSDPAEEADDVEQIYADPRLDVIGLIEDEVILSLPMVASHEPDGCQAVTAGDSGTGKDSPFSKLAALKRQ